LAETTPPGSRLAPIVLEIPMHDGVRLVADLYRPEGETGPWPVLLALTPYGRRNIGPMLAGAWVPHGYALLVVDVRGRYDSGGTFEPIIQERRDAPDVMAWLAAQPWLDRAAGVGTVGLSYLATAGFIAAADNPLVKAATCITVVVDMTGGMFRGGVLDLHHSFPWCVMTGASPQPDLRQWNWEQLFRHLPVATLDQAAGLDLPVWRQLLGGPGGEDVADRRQSIAGDLARCGAPVLHLGGWYDFILGESLNAYEILTRAGNAPQSLVLGPWNHTTIMSGETTMGGVNFGPEASSDLSGRLLQWFDYWLKGKGRRPAGLRAFVTGGTGWRELGTWPPEESAELRLYLDAGRADLTDLEVPSGQTAARGLHSLSIEAPAEYVAGFAYDPLDPTPTIGGAVWPFSIAGLVPGPSDQRPLLGREDGLFFVSAPLDRQVTALGPASVHLAASTGCQDTDFAVRILDMEPHGPWRIIQDGIARVRYRGGDLADPRPVRPGEEFMLDVDCWAVGHRFAPGHRVGLHIASANFPKYARNLNTGGDPLWGDNAAEGRSEDQDRGLLPVPDCDRPGGVRRVRGPSSAIPPRSAPRA